MSDATTLYSPASIRAQAAAILSAWGMASENVALTSEAMLDCDLRGISTHGISLLQLYEKWRADGGFNLGARDEVLGDGPATAAIDAQGGLGFPVSVRAVRLACEKARATGLAAVTVRNSRHFGAAGYYARLGAAEGMILFVASSTKVVCVVPPGAGSSVLGTNPLAYGIPRAGTHPIVFDMATSTAAGNKIRMFQIDGKAVPEGWVVDGQGQPVTDPDHAARIVYDGAPGGLTPLGSTPQMGAFKGYGLALLGHFLGGTLAGGTFSGARGEDKPKGDNIGHFFLALDPARFRDLVDFHSELDLVDRTLRGTPPVDPRRPILMPGDVEEALAARRATEGVPLTRALTDQLRKISDAAGADFILAPAANPQKSGKEMKR